jgi:GntR family transcriptional regulator
MADQISTLQLPLADPSEPGGPVGFRPLYRQVRDVFERRISDGTWAAGQALPSETQLAAELAVSQGTVRKALDEMTADKLLVRRQGRGTFVASHDEDRVLFQFFKLTPDSGDVRFPESRVLAVSRRKAGAADFEKLKLAGTSDVIVIDRIRRLGADPILTETIVLPAALFPGLDATEIPNNLYHLYSERFGVVVVRAQEQLKAVAAQAADAAALGIAVGTPLLAIDRVAWSIDNRPVEWRVSRCLTERLHYLSDLK